MMMIMIIRMIAILLLVLLLVLAFLVLDSSFWSGFWLLASGFRSGPVGLLALQLPVWSMYEYPLSFLHGLSSKSSSLFNLHTSKQMAGAQGAGRLSCGPEMKISNKAVPKIQRQSTRCFFVKFPENPENHFFGAPGTKIKF